MIYIISVIIVMVAIFFVVASVKQRKAEIRKVSEACEQSRAFTLSQEELTNTKEKLTEIQKKLVQTQDTLFRTEEYYYIRQRLHQAVVVLFSGDASMHDISESELDVITGVKMLSGGRYVYMLSATLVPALWGFEGLGVKDMLQRTINSFMDEFDVDFDGRKMVVDYVFGRDGYFLILISMKRTDLIDNCIYEEVESIWESLGIG